MVNETVPNKSRHATVIANKPEKRFRLAYKKSGFDFYVVYQQTKFSNYTIDR